MLVEPPNPSDSEGDLLPRSVLVVTAFVAASTLAAVSLLGPLWLNVIQHRTSASVASQAAGQDLVDLLLITPILVVGGVLLLLRRDGAKYFLVLSPIALMYTGLSYGLGQEWGNPAYPGNVERFSALFLILIVAGLVLTIGSLSLFRPEDAPPFRTRSLRLYVAAVSLLLLMFAAMWAGELVEVISTGDVSTGAYRETPNVWWVIRYLDLGVTIPVGFLALFLLLSRPSRAYPLVLLFFGFFVTLGSAVTAMAFVMLVRADPTLQPGGLVIFPLLTAMAWAGLLYLVKQKIPWLAGRRGKAPSGGV